jgi:DNA invertase Pin-like site-specific DNA recombinase
VRSLPDLVRVVGHLEKCGVGFESLSERIETVSAAGKLIFHVFAALAEFERTKLIIALRYIPVWAGSDNQEL